jgi:phage baseplate assembly protein W
MDGSNSHRLKLMSVINASGQVSTTLVLPDVTAELATPFRVDSTGALAVITDQVQRAVAHILAVAFTMPGERVMRPGIGIGVQRMVFENNIPAQFAQAANAMQASLTNIDGGFVVTTVNAVEQDGGTWVFSVSFTIDQDPVTHTALFDYQGNLSGYS